MTEKKIDPLAIMTRFPSPLIQDELPLSKEEKIAHIAERFREIMQILGLDLSDDSLAKTPERVAKMYVNEIFSGLDPSNFPSISFIEDEYKQQGQSNLVFIKANFCSFCEHHFVPMPGTAYVAYLPHRKLIGLSKIPRLVRFFSKRPQVQERLTAQIADSLSLLVETDSVAVSIQAEHYCIRARGIEESDSHAITYVFRGDFEKNAHLRSEFFDAVNRSK